LQSVNQICDVKFEKIFQKMEEKALATDNYVSQVRIENSKYATDLINATHELNIEWGKLENIRKEIYGKFDEEVEDGRQGNKYQACSCGRWCVCK
jgi:hypothetical protein